MELMEMLSQSIATGRKAYFAAEERPAAFVAQSAYEASADGSACWHNCLGLGDNAAFMTYLKAYKNMAGKVQMVYIDPPFFSGARYDAVVRLDAPALAEPVMARHEAYQDIWKDGMGEYLSMLACRLYLIRDLLCREGTVWVHVDWHASHYVRLLLDEIFGADRFVNEIIWTYKSGGSTKKHFARKHDTIFVYSRTKAYYFQPLTEKSYNRDLKPYRFKGVQEYQDETGWYTMVNMKDVWQINMVGRTAGERTGYATQKPEALLQRIIACSTRAGDICADFFCGSGTLAAVAGKMHRRWLCCDAQRLAVGTTWQRVIGDMGADGEPILLLTAEPQEKKQEAAIVALDKKPYGDGQNRLIRLSLTGYRPEAAEAVPLAVEGKAAFRRIAQAGGLELVNGWSVDFHYDGQVHRPQQIMCRTQKGLVLSAEAVCQKDAWISVEVVDLLGNRSLTVLKGGL